MCDQIMYGRYEEATKELIAASLALRNVTTLYFRELCELIEGCDGAVASVEVKKTEVAEPLGS